MANATDLRDLSVDEVESRLSETREELFNLRFQNANGQLDNYKRLGELRKEVARIKTVLRERELSESEGEG
jgi:large subunit ribosomal protein L29